MEETNPKMAEGLLPRLVSGSDFYNNLSPESLYFRVSLATA